MKRKIETLFVLALIFAVLLSSCAKSGGNYYQPASAPTTINTITPPVYNCRFWVKDPYGLGDQYVEVPAGILKVTIGGETKTLFYYYHEAGPSGCGAVGTVNFNLPAGPNNWTATTLNGSRSWSGQTVVPANGCAIHEITF